MAGPYNPPNPYGAYFSFGQPEAMTGQAYGPMPFGTLTPGAMAMSGVGSGGFNPTSMEYLRGKVQEQYQQRFMAELMRNDPRVMSVSNALLSGSKAKDINNIFGSRGNFQEMVGWAMSQPGIASMIGGSPLAIGQGAYASMSGGMRINGMSMFGDGPMQMMGAQALAAHMTRQFYFQGGGANPMATSGMNRDQIGGIMMLGASQGAFSGMNLGTLTAQGNKLNLNMDQNTMSKISQFTKTAAKALSGLIDIYGDASIAELAAKANQITGLNFNQLGNAQLIQNRLASLRAGASATGIDTGTMFDLAGMGTQMGMSMGLHSRFAGNVGGAAAIRAAEVFRANQGQAGSFLTATTSMQEIAGGLVRDQAAMMRDPVGRRRAAMTLALDTGHFRGAEAEARALIREDGAGAMGRMDMFMRAHGLDMGGFTRMMGGPEGIQSMLSEGSMDDLNSINRSTVRSRAGRLFRRQAGRAMNGFSGSAAEGMMGLIEGLGKDTLEKIFEGTRSGFNEDSVNQALGGDPAGRLHGKKYLEMVRNVVGGMGGNNAAAMHASLQQAISVNPFLKSNFTTTSAEMGISENRLAALKFTSDDRGSMRSGLFDGLLDRLGGDDMRSTFVAAMMTNPGSVFGMNGGIFRPGVGDKFDPDRTRRTASALIGQMGRDKDGQAALAKLGIGGISSSEMTVEQLQALHTKLADPIQFAMAFSGFQVATVGEGSNASTMFMKKDVFNNTRQNKNVILASQALAKNLEGGDYSAQSAHLNKMANVLNQHPDRADRALSAMVAHTSNIGLLTSIDSKKLEAIAKSSPQWSGGMMSFLEKEAERNKGDDSMLAKIKGLEEVFSKYGATAKESGGKMTINGTLELVGNALQLKAAMGEKK